MYDKIALDWKKKRSNPWSIFTKFYFDGLKRWSQIFKTEIEVSSHLHLDLGAGSGRHSDFFLQLRYRLIDLDLSREMLRNNKSHSLKIQASLHALPFRPNQFDSITAVASIHHIQGQMARAETIKDICRISKAKALICITVWRFYQPKFITEYLNQLHKSFSRTDLEIGDVIVSWSLENSESQSPTEKIERFYHLFRAQEFHQLMRPFRKIEKIAIGNRQSKDNFFFIGYNEKNE